MLLAIDVGNTNINMGVYREEKLEKTFRLMTTTQRSSDEFGMMILGLLEANGMQGRDISGVIIASVVPKVMHALTGAVERYLKKKPMIVGPGVKTGIHIVTENPKEIGADRVANAVAAFGKYGGPVLILDFGTATVYDLVTAKGEYTVGITSPGMRISAQALWTSTAKLPEVEIEKPASILAQNTTTSMQAGLVYGQIGATEYIIRRVKEESGLGDMKVVCTGGLGSIIAPETNLIDVYDRNLTLDGLQMIYRKNR